MRSLVSTVAFFLFLTVVLSCTSESSSEKEPLSLEEIREVGRIIKLISPKLPKVEGKIKCDVCTELFDIVETILQTNSSVTVLDEIAFQICLKLEIPGWTPFVCHGTIREFGAEVVYVLTERFFDSEMICAALGYCSSDNIDFSSTKNPLLDVKSDPAWQMMMEQTLETIRIEQQLPRLLDTSTGSFIHLSDIHYDERYKEGANTLCDRPQCCREISSFPNQTQFSPAGPWGDYNCDTPIPLLQNIWQTFTELEEKPDFIIYTGDNSAHDIWAQTQTLQQQRTVRLFEGINEALPEWMFYATLGNHESFPVDQFASPPDMQWLYQAVADSLSPWLSEEDLLPFRYAGYYTTLITPGLRLISLNTQYCDANDFWLLLDWQDPGGQISWFNQTLAAAKSGNEKVWITGHIPFNSASCIDSYQQPLLSLVDTYQDIITAIFFGHTHHDSFVVFKDFATNTKPIAVGYITPSVTPYKEKNNAFRVMEYNRTTFELTNYHQYILNLTDANVSGTPNWFKEYDPVSTYRMSSLSPAEWLNVAEKFQFDQQLFNLYEYYYTCSFDVDTSCTGTCKNSTICDLTSSTTQINNACKGTEPGHGLSDFINRFCPAWWFP